MKTQQRFNPEIKEGLSFDNEGKTKKLKEICSAEKLGYFCGLRKILEQIRRTFVTKNNS